MSFEDSEGFDSEHSGPDFLGAELLFDSAPWRGLFFKDSLGFTSERSDPGFLGVELLFDSAARGEGSFED